MAKIITFFNHKGGVGKTTILYHLAWKFTQNNLKVLVVDADAQCNLSNLCLGEDRFAQHYLKHPEDNIKSGLAAAFESRPKLIDAIQCPKVGSNSKLFLLPGSFDLTEYETQLSVAINFNTTFLTMANLPGSFYKLLSACAEKYKVDYVFIDLNPGLSAINQTLLFSSNYFVIPCGVDYFSKQAIRSLAKILPIWANWSVKAKEHFKDSVYPMPPFSTQFLGYTVNNFNTRKKRPALAVRKMIEELDLEVAEELIPKLQEKHMILDRVGNDFRLAQIKSFNTLQQISHSASKPVFNLTKNDTGNEGFVQNTQELSIKDVNTLFENLYSKITNLIDDAQR